MRPGGGPSRAALHAVLAILVVAALNACSTASDFSAAEKAVPVFHSQLDGGNFETIYAHASPKLKQADSEKKLDAFLGAVHRKLGTVASSKQINSGVNFGTSGTFVTLIYKTNFSGGEATEKFVYEMDGGKALLAGYNINSDALIEK